MPTKQACPCPTDRRFEVSTGKIAPPSGNQRRVRIIDRPRLTEDIRRSQRNPVSWRARVSLGNAGHVDCRTFDISRGGVGLLSPEGFPAGAVVLVALQVPATAASPSSGSAPRIVAAKAVVAFQILSSGQYRTGFQWIAPGEALLAAFAPWTQDTRE